MDHNVTVTKRQQSITRADNDDDDPKTVHHIDGGCGGGGSGRIGGSIAERRAATCGFKAENINTARFRASGSPLGSPSARSPYLTIPPGIISPTVLLDSPIMLPNAQASPTTGTFLVPQVGQELNNSNGDGGSNMVSSFTSKPQDLDSQPSFCSLEDQVSSSFNLVQRAVVDHQPVHLDTPLDFEFPAELSKEATSRSFPADSVAEVKVLDNVVNDNSNLGFNPSELASDQTFMQKEPLHGQDVGRNLSDGDQKGTRTAMDTARTSEDGYNWRKYGQKQVKGSEYPRSYYKCTHPNCQVKKKVERSLDGQITEIIYKGAHNHPEPQPCRRPSLGSSLSSDEMSESAEGSGICVKVVGGLLWKNARTGSKDIKLGSEQRADGVERTSSTSVVTDLSDPVSTAQGKSVGAFESAETPEFPSTVASQDDENDDRATQGSISLCDDAANDDESESKRRKTESCFTEMTVASGALREPRVVVQIESDVDILDDGYRWRKYGQKVVKGNPNPRSYYKCTSPGCPVRKHVERASHNLKFVLTTYDGKHNHEVPAARSSSHVNSAGCNLPPTMPNTQASLPLSINSHPLKSETPIQDIAPPFDQRPEFKNVYVRPNFFGDFSNEMKLGAASLGSVYQMKYPSIVKAIPYGSFGLNPNCMATHSSGSIVSTVPKFPISLPLHLPTSANLSLAGFEINNGGRSTGPTHSFLPGQLKENNTRFHGIKQELKDDNVYDPCIPIVDHASTSSSSVYQQASGNFPS